MKLAILGGDPVRRKDFPNRVSMGPEEKAAALRVLDSDVLSGFVGAAGEFFNGAKEVRDLESAWASRYGFKHAISVNSWTAGLQVAAGAIGIEPGDEVICPPYTMSATSTAMLFYGGIPIFADIDPTRYSLDPASIEARITPRTRAIVVVHLFGYPADMDSIMAIARKHRLKVIEDAAQAPGVLYRGQPVGAIGDIGGFSLNFHKHIHTGEGGLLVTNDDQLALRSQLIRNHGENATEAYGVEDISNTIGSNYRFTELQAAIASEQFKKLPAMLEHRKQLGLYLDQRLESLPGLTIQKLEPGSTHAYYMYPLRYDENVLGVPRSVFLRAVLAELPRPRYWDTTPLAEGYVKPLYLNPVYQQRIAIGRKGFPFNMNPDVAYEYPKGLCPVVERLYEKELLLSPLVREGMSKSDVADFADAIEKVVSNIGELRDAKLEAGTGVYDAVKAIDDYVKPE
ncbi:DegT/DnrJ/EryC1/StrS family aminotransferase [Alkalilimnicola sp. S0819]|uniref:DegT/DnrJ/EryC1/StrS family aminotransferase n=1 Tax=Alkalilimnicola sp. S0819 TaxID=2613922 RepID=UPI0012622A28|nr:DegT/DnrJ/EryC1/StrS family aminotransferase [Alkalilimnicola sp. S0819]KAB7628239.1 DegT/DnrJ/EryC1/StrS family aminotransferase [Alkalilimnicola sp. S0819]MPQ15130.1 DegT/DnrJ/EryC1/StrS family aminotransferase [Alkalilimnicola sp. S0819]